MVAKARKRRKLVYNKAEVQLRNQFRLLWEQHVYWTRMVITGIAFDSPDLEASTARLLRNVPDFEEVLERFYSSEDVTAFGELLRDHLVIAAELVQAAKSGNNAEVATLRRRWYDNAEEIVQQMSMMNPFWRPRDLNPMWREHLDLTLNEAVQVLSGEYNESVATFDQIEEQAMEMADSFWLGIIRQFDVASAGK